MNNNTILRQLRYIFDYNDAKMMDVFALADLEVSREEVRNWLRREDDEDYISLHDKKLATFLNGFITEHRGKKDGPTPKPEKTLNNNLIFRKLKIALQLKDTDIIELLKEVGLRISKHEISAFFRSPKQKQYRLCKDQFLRNFLFGLQVKYRGRAE